ncbi:hypothetical protein RUND412_001897 [Rhizina undulata]
MPRPVRTRKPPSAAPASVPAEPQKSTVKDKEKISAVTTTKEPSKLTHTRPAKNKSDAPVPVVATSTRATRANPAAAKEPIEKKKEKGKEKEKEPTKRVHAKAAAAGTPTGKKRSTRLSVAASTASVLPTSFPPKRVTRRRAVKQIKEEERKIEEGEKEIEEGETEIEEEEEDTTAADTIVVATSEINVEIVEAVGAQVPLQPSTPPAATPPSPNSDGLSQSQSSKPASSDRENHSPSPEFPSSPPVIESTPKQPKRRAALEFSPGAGYTPPPPSRAPPTTSAERPRLRELETMTLEPIDNAPLEPMEEDTEPSASPTPRGKVVRVSTESENGTPSPTAKKSAKPKEYGFFLEGDDEEFVIYSDPKSSPGNRAELVVSIETMTGTMRPPESSPLSSPAEKGKGRKRRSSGAIVEDEDDGEDTVVEDDRHGKRRRTRNKEKGKMVMTEQLRELLPRRRRNKAADVFDIPNTSEEPEESEDGEESEDELSAMKTRGRAAKKKPAPKNNKVSKGKEKATVPVITTGAKKPPSGVRTPLTKEAWSRPLTARKAARTYSKKVLENQQEGEESEVSVTTLADSSANSSVEVADGRVDGEGRRKLKAVVDKFKEVDQWELDFEDVSPSSGIEAAG